MLVQRKGAGTAWGAQVPVDDAEDEPGEVRLCE
jgi:hypothetical protein